MARYIDAEKISSHIRENFSIDKTKNAGICFAFIDFMNWLDEQPTVDVVEVKHGHWIKSGNEKKCSVCDFVYYSNKDEWNGCPNCLSRMDGKGTT